MCDVFHNIVFSNGQEEQLFRLRGTIPVTYQGTVYDGLVYILVTIATSELVQS